MRAIKTTPVLAVLLLIAAACGGGSDAATTSTTSGSTATTAGSAPTTTGAASETTLPTETTPPETSGESFATVTIGSETFEFAPTGFMTERCDPDFFGGFWVLFTTGVSIVLPGEDWAAQGIDDGAMVEVKVEDQDLEWFADAAADPFGFAPGQSQVDSYVIDGNRASGTATFVERNATFAAVGGGDAVVPVTGSFEAFCAG